jgi:hypothetical protein
MSSEISRNSSERRAQQPWPEQLAAWRRAHAQDQAAFEQGDLATKG